MRVEIKNLIVDLSDGSSAISSSYAGVSNAHKNQYDMYIRLISCAMDSTNASNKKCQPESVGDPTLQTFGGYVDTVEPIVIQSYEKTYKDTIMSLGVL